MSPSNGQPKLVATITSARRAGVVQQRDQLGDVVERLVGRAVHVVPVVRVARRHDDLDLPEAGGERPMRARRVRYERRVVHAVGVLGAAQTSSASAICGIAFGCTNETASIRRTPVSDSASSSSILAAVGTGSSFCSPSRGPTSRIETLLGIVATLYHPTLADGYSAAAAFGFGARIRPMMPVS